MHEYSEQESHKKRTTLVQVAISFRSRAVRRCPYQWTRRRRGIGSKYRRASFFGTWPVDSHENILRYQCAHTFHSTKPEDLNFVSLSIDSLVNLVTRYSTDRFDTVGRYLFNDGARSRLYLNYIRFKFPFRLSSICTRGLDTLISISVHRCPCLSENGSTMSDESDQFFPTISFLFFSFLFFFSRKVSLQRRIIRRRTSAFDNSVK